MTTIDPSQHDPLVDEARRTAVDAARQAGIEVAHVHDPAEARAVAALLDAVWGREQATGQVLTPEALTALAHSGCQVTLARRRPGAHDATAGTAEAVAAEAVAAEAVAAEAVGEIVAATAAWLGRDPATGEVALHSHVTGVRPGLEGRGIGRAMKWEQRAWALEHRIATVRWTFDPLIRRNAVLNLVRLGATVTGYDVDLYGPMADTRNHALPTDRVTAVWDLAAPRVRAAARGRAASPDVAALRSAGAEVALAVGDGDTPVRHGTDAARRLIQVPPDIERLRLERPEVALAWTHAIRATLGTGLDAGARVTGITRDGWYVLASAGGVQELAAGARDRPRPAGGTR